MLRKKEYFELANRCDQVMVVGEKTGRHFRMHEFVFGVLIPDHYNPLSCVSVSNSSLSIDTWKGCSFQCAYCHVHDCFANLEDGKKMGTKAVRANPFSVEKIVESLIAHPFFVPNVSVISIATASTEPFASEKVIESTFDIMKTFVRRGFRNPFWIVTKAGVPAGRKQDFEYIATNTNGLMISICWADNPRVIEPARSNRFRHIAEAKNVGATISWYMRPLVNEWGANPEHIERMMIEVKDDCGELIDMIIPGGLRWADGVEYALTEARNIPMPDIPRDENIKDLPDDLWSEIVKLADKYFPGIPLLRHSACGLSLMLNTPNIVSIQATKPADCLISQCPQKQREICAKGRILEITTEEIQFILDDLAIPAKVIGKNENGFPITIPPMDSFSYAVRRSLLKAISTGGEVDGYTRTVL